MYQRIAHIALIVENYDDAIEFPPRFGGDTNQGDIKLFTGRHRC